MLPGRESLGGVLVGELEEDEGWEDGADTGAHGAAHQAQHQLDVGHQDPHHQADQEHGRRDQVEPGGGQCHTESWCGGVTNLGYCSETAG